MDDKIKELLDSDNYELGYIVGKAQGWTDEKFIKHFINSKSNWLIHTDDHMLDIYDLTKKIFDGTIVILIDKNKDGSIDQIEYQFRAVNYTRTIKFEYNQVINEHSFYHEALQFFNILNKG